MTAIDLAGRHALVTGGARGLGTAMAQALVDSGASVVIADLLDEEGTASAKTLSDNGTKAAFVHLDVIDDDNWAIAVEEAIAAIGGFDILVNNAGIEITQLVADLDAADTLRMLSVNVLGTALGTKHAFRAMRPGGAAGNGGAVINTASVAAAIAFPGIAIYSATKSAIDRLTRVSAMEAGKSGHGVRVNCAELGLFPSPTQAVEAVVGRTPLGRLGEPADMADAVAFLASDAARFITGVGLPVDGGMGM